MSIAQPRFVVKRKCLPQTRTLRYKLLVPPQHRLSGSADANQDGSVTAGELFAYIHDHVAAETQNQQTPVALPGLADNLPLSGIGMRRSAQMRPTSPTPPSKPASVLGL